MRTGSELKPKTRRGVITGVIFGLLFLLPGLGFGLFGVIPAVYDAVRMQDWVSVPAELLHAELKRNTSGDGDTYRVVGRYRYQFDGRLYESTRIGIHGGSDNIGDWHRETYHAMRAARPFRVWVNPDDPAEAVYDRGLRWGFLGFLMIFVVLFGGVGALIIYAVLRKEDPPRPADAPLWQAVPEWQTNQIRSGAKGKMWGAWLFAIVWNLISTPVAFIVPRELERENYLVLLALIFPLIGAGILIYAIKATLRWRRFGPTLLQLDPFPGDLGGIVGGSVELKLPYDPKTRFTAVLTCNHVYTRDTGDSRETVRDAKWQDEQVAVVEPGMRGTRVRFAFDTPADTPQSADPDDDGYEWTVNLRSEMAGVDFDRDWKIPVFLTRARAAAESVTPQPKPRHQAPVPLPENIVTVRETGAGMEFDYPRSRRTGMALSIIVFGLVFSSVLYARLLFDFDIPLIFPIVFGLFGTLLLLSGLYFLGHSLRVIVAPDGLHVDKNVYGINFKRYVARDDIAKLGKRITMQQKSGTRTSARYSLQAKTRSGQSLSIGDSLPSASSAQEILEKIVVALALDRKILVADRPALSVREKYAQQPAQGSMRKVRFVSTIISLFVFCGIVYAMFGDVIGKLFVQLWENLFKAKFPQ